MTAGRGALGLALVVFSSWGPCRLVVGAYLFGAVTILQLHAQGAGLGIPSQFMSALPYLATVIVLVLIWRPRTGGSTPPPALGTVVVPDPKIPERRPLRRVRIGLASPPLNLRKNT